MDILQPYYQDEIVKIYHGDCREILPLLEPKSVDLVLTDPPYGANKAVWDETFPSWVFSLLNSPVVAIIPGIANLLNMPNCIGSANYQWALSVRIVNGMTRGKFGFGNWIACLVWAEDGVSLNHQYQDGGEVVIRGDMPLHPSPKPSVSGYSRF